MPCILSILTHLRDCAKIYHFDTVPLPKAKPSGLFHSGYLAADTLEDTAEVHVNLAGMETDAPHVIVRTSVHGANGIAALRLELEILSACRADLDDIALVGGELQRAYRDLAAEIAASTLHFDDMLALLQGELLRRAALASMTEREPVVTELQAVDDRTCAHGYAPGERKRLLRTLLHVVKLLAIILVAAKRRPVDAIFQILYIHYCSV